MLERWRALVAVVVVGGLAVVSPTPVAAATFTVPGGGVNPIPDAPANCWLTAGAPLDVTFDVDGVSGSLRDVAVTIEGEHSYVGDLEVALIAPDGTAHVIFSGVGVTGSGGECGDGSGFVGPYTFTDQASASFADAAAAVDFFEPVPAGTYRTSTAGGSLTSMTPVFAGLADLNGKWTLRVVDWSSGDSGSITAASLTLTTPAAVPVLSSQVQRTVLEVGGSVEDLAVLSGSDGATGSLAFEVFGPDDEACATTPVFTSTVEVDGDGEYLSEAFTPTAPGVYRWVVTYAGDENNDPVSTVCGDLAQTVSVDPVPAPVLALAKVAGGIVDVDGDGASAGDTVTYGFTVTNSGNVPLDFVTVDDPMLGGAIGCGIDTLAPGSSRTCESATYVLGESDLGSTLVNTATASALFSAEPSETVTASATVTTPIPSPCVAPSDSEAPETTEQPAAASESAVETSEPPTATTEPPTATSEPPTATSEQPDTTVEQPDPTIEPAETTVEETVVAETVSVPPAAVTASTEASAPFGFRSAQRALPVQVDPCALPPTTVIAPAPTAPAATPTPAVPVDPPPIAPPPATATGGGAGGSSGGGAAGPGGSLPATGADPAAALAAAAILTAGLALTGATRHRRAAAIPAPIDQQRRP